MPSFLVNIASPASQNVNVNDGHRLPFMSVYGNAILIPNGDTSPTSGDNTDFGETYLSTTLSKSFEIRNADDLGNLGTADLENIQVAVPVGFEIVPGEEPDAVLAPGASTFFQIRCLAGSEATFSGTVSITADGDISRTFTITCDVVLARISALGNGLVIPNGDTSPSSTDHTDYGDTLVLTTVTRTFTLRNADDANVSGTANLTNLTVTGIPSGYTLTVAPASSVAPGASTTFQLRCDAAAEQVYAGTVTITADHGISRTFDVTCNSDLPVMQLVGNGNNINSGDTSPSTSDFTDFDVINTATSKTFTIQNNGLVPLTIGVRNYPSGFTETVTPAATVNPGSSTTFTVQATAASFGVFEGNMTIANNSAVSPYTVKITVEVEPAYDLRVTFRSGTPSAGTFNGEVGSITITDSAGLFSQDNGLKKATAVGGGTNDPRFVGAASFARTAGKRVSIKYDSTGVATSVEGPVWASNSGGTTAVNAINPNNTLIRSVPGFPTPILYQNDAVYIHNLVMASSGAFYFSRGGDLGNHQLLDVQRDGTTTPLYPSFFSLNANNPELHISNFLVPTPVVNMASLCLISDDFNRANGAPGNTNNYAGGATQAWTDQVGTSVISSNALGWSALSGGIGITTVDAGNANAVILADLTRSAGNIGLVFRYVNANNYLRLYHDGTNLKLDKVVGGVVSNIRSRAMTYSAGALVMLRLNRNKLVILYNKANANNSNPFEETITDSVLLTSSIIGGYTTDTGNTLDNFAAYPTGSAGEYNTALYQRRESARIHVSYEGDSLTLGTQGTAGITESYPYLLTRALGNGYEGTNYAQSGQKATDIVTDVSYTVAAFLERYKRSIVCLWIGTNDIGVSTPTTIYNNIVSYCNTVRSSRTKVVVGNLIARGTFTPGNNTDKATLNTNLASGWPGFADAFVDLAGFFTNSSDTTYYQADTVHLKAAGYAKVKDMFLPVIQGLSW